MLCTNAHMTLAACAFLSSVIFCSRAHLSKKVTLTLCDELFWLRFQLASLVSTCSGFALSFHTRLAPSIFGVARTHTRAFTRARHFSSSLRLHTKRPRASDRTSFHSLHRLRLTHTRAWCAGDERDTKHINYIIGMLLQRREKLIEAMAFEFCRENFVFVKHVLHCYLNVLDLLYNHRIFEMNSVESSDGTSLLP